MPAEKPRPMDMALHGAHVESPDTVARIGVVLRIAGEPVNLRHRLSACLAEHLPDLPVLSHVITGSGRGRRWSHVEPDLDVHVLEHPLDRGAPVEDTLQRVLRMPFPDNAPPWDIHVLPGHQQDEYCLFLRIHHAVLDGGGLVHLLEKLCHPHELSGHANSLMAGSRTPARLSARHLATAGRLLARNASWTDFWRKAGFTPSVRRCFRWASVPTTALRATARAHDVTANDVYLAAYATAFWSWAAAHAPGIAEEDLELIVPVDIRRIDELSTPGNRSAPVRIVLPARTSGSRELIDAVARATAPVKSPSVRRALAVLTSHTPMPLHSAMWRALLTAARATPAASNVVVRHALEFDGDPVLSMAPLMPLPEGFPCTAVLLSYQDTATLCVVSDPALPGMVSLHERWQRVVEEMAAQTSGDRGEERGKQR